MSNFIELSCDNSKQIIHLNIDNVLMVEKLEEEKDHFYVHLIDGKLKAPMSDYDKLISVLDIL